MERNNEIIKPTIIIYTTPTQANGPMLTAILNGIEEESVFCAVRQENADAKSLSEKAAKESRLEVGIGIDDKHVSLSYKRMDTPMFFEPVDIVSRKIGTNAARLVKNVPFL